MTRFWFMGAAAVLGTTLAGSSVMAADRATGLALKQADTAECIAQQNPNAVDALLATVPGSRVENQRIHVIAAYYSGCAGETAELVTSGGKARSFVSLRAALAAARVATMKQGMRATTQASAWYEGALKGRAGVDFDPDLIAFEQFGDCVVSAAPEASAALVASSPGSSEEGEALAGLKPVLAGCVTTGTQMRFTASNLRTLVSEPLYHRLKA